MRPCFMLPPKYGYYTKHGQKGRLRLRSHMLRTKLTAWGPVRPFSPIQVQFRSEFLPEFAPESEPKMHRTLFKCRLELCEQASLRAGQTLLSCELDAVENPHPIRMCMNPA